jgi:DNA-binding transcriptional LysR family regulator
LKSLEEEVGATLFRRINAGLYPTAQARRLLRAAEPLLAIEAFARRWLAAPRKRQIRLLTVDLDLTYTIGGIAMAIQRAIDAMAAARRRGLDRREGFCGPRASGRSVAGNPA